MKAPRLIRRLSAPFAALLVFGTAGILAMIVALAAPGGSAPVSRPLLSPRPAPGSAPPTPTSTDTPTPTADGSAADAATPPPLPSAAPELMPAVVAGDGKHHHHDQHPAEGD